MGILIKILVYHWAFVLEVVKIDNHKMAGVLISKPMKVTAYTPVDQWSMAYFRERMEAIHYTENTSVLLCLIKIDQG